MNREKLERLMKPRMDSLKPAFKRITQNSESFFGHVLLFYNFSLTSLKWVCGCLLLFVGIVCLSFILDTTCDVTDWLDDKIDRALGKGYR